MILSRFLPATDVNWATSSVDTVRRLSAAKQNAFNHIVMARVELIRLSVFSAIELSIHVIAAAAKFTIAVIELPACLFAKSLKPRLAFNESGAHAIRAVKLAGAMLCAPLVGIANPLWSVSVYQRLSLVDQPQGPFAKLVNGVTAAWKSSYRNPALLGTLLVGGALLGKKYLTNKSDESNFYQYIGQYFTGNGVANMAIFGSLVWLLALRGKGKGWKCAPRPGQWSNPCGPRVTHTYSKVLPKNQFDALKLPRRVLLTSPIFGLVEGVATEKTPVDGTERPMIKIQRIKDMNVTVPVETLGSFAMGMTLEDLLALQEGNTISFTSSDGEHHVNKKVDFLGDEDDQSFGVEGEDDCRRIDTIYGFKHLSRPTTTPVDRATEEGDSDHEGDGVPLTPNSLFDGGFAAGRSNPYPSFAPVAPLSPRLNQTGFSRPSYADAVRSRDST